MGIFSLKWPVLGYNRHKTAVRKKEEITNTSFHLRWAHLWKEMEGTLYGRWALIFTTSDWIKPAHWCEHWIHGEGAAGKRREAVGKGWLEKLLSPLHWWPHHQEQTCSWSPGWSHLHFSGGRWLTGSGKVIQMLFLNVLWLLTFSKLSCVGVSLQRHQLPVLPASRLEL